MRIVSLLPSATEIVCALGARDMLAGVSHECDFPPVVSCLPVLTSPRYGIPRSADRATYAAALAAGATQSHSAQIDATIRDIRLDALSPYLLDGDLLASLDPDIVLTQDLCEVCAPSLEEVRSAVRQLCRPTTRVVSLTPQRLGDVWTDIATVGTALGLEDAARRLVDELKSRLHAILDRVHSSRTLFRTVLTLEWFDPVMDSGLWMPELVELAGGIEVARWDAAAGQHTAAIAGQRSRTLSREELWQLNPDVIVLKPCGLMLDEACAELGTLLYTTPWARWRAVQRGEAYVMDGSAYFNRPGPRLVESCELLAAALHPTLFPELRDRYRDEVLRIGPGLEATLW